MPVTVSRIMDCLEGIAPLSEAEEWDNAGLLAGRWDAPVDTVLCALDLTMDVLEEARRNGAQMIVTHHPILFRGRQNLREDDGEGRLLCALVRSGIAMAAMHTNYDNASPGVNDALAETLGLSDVTAVGKAMRVGTPAQALLRDFAGAVERALGEPVRMYGAPDRPLRRVAVLGGSGGDYVPDALSAGVDAFVTGEISYHRALDAVENGLCVLEAGHGATERPGIITLARGLQNAADALQYDIRVLNSRAGLFYR